ncbi:glucosyltransferase [Tilletia horrida]|nr:glucosyltransferase [Tilletia horrida]
MAESSLQRGLASLSPLLYAVPLTVAAGLVNQIVPEPYLDEIFHIPQAEAYCEGRWDVWDPKLTTPPGVYLVYVAIHRLILAPVFGMSCLNSAAMRSVNAIALLLVARTLQALLSRVRKEADANSDPPTYAEVAQGSSPVKGSGVRTVSPETAMRKAIEDPQGSARDARAAIAQAEAVAADSFSSPFGVLALDAHIIAFLPPLWFFGLLFYTDVCSLLSVVACMLWAKEGRHGSASLAGLASLLFRQTNIIWVVFILATSIVGTLHTHGLSDAAASDVSPSSIIATLISAVKTLSQPQALTAVVSLMATYAPVLLAFAGFLLWNGSIVLGDKSNHVAALHFPQLLYFAAFSVIFGWPAIAATTPSLPALVRRTVKNLVGGWTQVLLTTVSVGAAVAAVHLFTIEHPFLLADNRHYAFYIWRRIVKAHPYARYALAPVYVVCGRLAWDALAPTRSFIWMLGFCAALVLTLVPSPLIEPRYFLVPYVVWRAHIVPAGVARRTQADTGQGAVPLWQAAEGAWYLLINVVTVAVFLYRPFKWPSEAGWQRFMW